MWELASVLNFLNVFRPLLNINAEFSVEELETALLTPNRTLDDIHMPLLKAIPPVIRMAMGRGTWVSVLCRKLRDWWHWVAEGEIPIVASQGAEIEAYKTLDPKMRVLILKALCDIRVEQEDIRNFIDNSVKRGLQISAFRKERIGGDSHGVSYWYEDDPIIGHRLYREIKQVEIKKAKSRGSSVVPLVSLQWETVATNLDEFEEVSEKLFSSNNRTEVSLGKKLKIDYLPDIEKIHKKKERLLKKQHREALLLDSYLTADGLTTGRSLRDRKPVTYTFDDYDKSISEAIKITKKMQDLPDNAFKKPVNTRSEVPANGKSNGPAETDQDSYDMDSPMSNDYDEADEDDQDENLDRSNRRRKRPQRYSEKDYVEAVSDMDADLDSDDDIVGEAVYDEEYLRSKRQKRASSGSEGDEEYRWEEENVEEDEEEDEYSQSTSEEMEKRPNKRYSTRNRRGTKLRSVDELQSGLRRSKRSTRPRVDYRQYEMSDSDSDSGKPSQSNTREAESEASGDLELSSESEDNQEQVGEDKTENIEEHIEPDPIEEKPAEKTEPVQEGSGANRRTFLDLNELAPVTGFDDGPITKDENIDDQ